VTTRGMNESDVEVMGGLILEALKTKESDEQAKIREKVEGLARRFPLPGVG
jgi:glycine/serine hydroxymethyltransferase